MANDTNGRANVGEAESKGAEIAVNAVLFETARQTLDFDVAAAFLDTQVLSFNSARVADVLSTVGDPLPGAPEVTAPGVADPANDRRRPGTGAMGRGRACQ